MAEAIRAGGLACIGGTITGGDTVTQDGLDYRVPKRHLVATLSVLLTTDRLKVAASLPLAPVLATELRSFRASVTAAAHEVYGAAAGQHDDLVLAVALAAWVAEHGGGQAAMLGAWGSASAGRVPERPSGGDLPRGWRP